tara:strand:- start:926 stop:1306 length:381 start_codon:yes stop_codon:yes gene_type:complete
MSFVDNTFKGLPEQLLGTFGINVTYIKTATSQSYNATTGEITSDSDTNISIKALISSVSGSTYEGTSQTNDLKIIFGNKELGSYYPKVKDRIQFVEDGVNKVARIISVNTSRGNSPILHTVIVRVQ